MTLFALPCPPPPTATPTLPRYSNKLAALREERARALAANATRYWDPLSNAYDPSYKPRAAAAAVADELEEDDGADAEDDSLSSPSRPHFDPYKKPLMCVRVTGAWVLRSVHVSSAPYRATAAASLASTGTRSINALSVGKNRRVSGGVWDSSNSGVGFEHAPKALGPHLVRTSIAPLRKDQARDQRRWDTEFEHAARRTAFWSAELSEEVRN